MIKSLMTKLRSVSALEYLDAVEKNGRSKISSGMRKDLVDLFLLADALKSDSAHYPKSDRDAIRFVSHALASEYYLWKNPRPRYVAYTNLALLDAYLLADQQVPIRQKWLSSKHAIAIILEHWVNFEEARIAAFRSGKLPSAVLGYDSGAGIDHIHERVDALSLLFDSLPIEGVPDTRIIKRALNDHETDWHYFAAHPDLQLAHFCCFPQSLWHDETMFLKMIHLTECCFSGILSSLEPMPVLVLSSDWINASELLKESLFYSDFLIRAWSVFETMPVGHFFDGFREATGDSSAIQSMRFQKLDVLTRGIGKHKREALATQLEAARHATWEPPEEATLPGAVRLSAREGSPAATGFIGAAEALDRDLHKWRTRHLGIARKYLPKDATGTGNEGVPYLEATYKTPRLRDALASEVSTAPTAEDTLDSSCPARVSATYRLSREAPPVALVEASDFQPIDGEGVVRDLYDRVRALPGRDVTRHHESYQKFFRGHSFPIAKQWQSFEKRGRIPTSTAPAVLLAAEFLAGLLMGLHSGERLSGTLVVDTARRDESYVGISGNVISCSLGEFVLRDAKGIFASFTQGPDQRTKVNIEEGSQPKRLIVPIMGFPSLGSDELHKGLSVAVEVMQLLGASSIREWVLYEG